LKSYEKANFTLTSAFISSNSKVFYNGRLETTVEQAIYVTWICFSGEKILVGYRKNFIADWHLTPTVVV